MKVNWWLIFSLYDTSFQMLMQSIYQATFQWDNQDCIIEILALKCPNKKELRPKCPGKDVITPRRTNKKEINPKMPI